MTDSEYTITTLRDNPGIFYETIGEMRTTEISWKMLIYIDLVDIFGATEGIRRELSIALQQCNEIPETCKAHRKLSMLETKLYKTMQYQEHVEKLIGSTRTRRAPFDFIGQVSKVLFGTLTTEDAQSIYTAIEHVENKTNDLATLLINQTMATRTRFGELYNATLKIRQQLTTLHKQIHDEIHNLTDDYVQNKIHYYFELVIEHINRAILEHEIDLNILIDGILFGKQGLIHPRMIPPHSLVENSKLIKEQVPHAEFPVSITEEEIDRLVKVSDLRIAYVKRRLVYILHVPLLTPGKYKLYKAIPVPVRQSFDVTKYAAIRPNAMYIALNEDSDSFYDLQEDELRECTFSDNTYICPTIFPLRKIYHATYCDVELLLNKNIKTHNCQIVLKEMKDTYWKSLTTPGTWIYSTVIKEKIRIECPNSTKYAEIENSGIITIKQGCKIRTKSTTISHPSVHTTEFEQPYIPTNNLSISELYRPIQTEYHVTLTDATQEIWTTNNSQVEVTFNDIIKRAEEIRNRKTREWKLISYNATACGVGILGTLALIAYIAYQGSCISNTGKLLNKGCSSKKAPASCPSRQNKSTGTETADSQSASEQ